MPAPAPSKKTRGGDEWLQVATRIAGLLAALVALVYVIGALVLGLRLALQDLPWANVVSQLPREFLLSVGAGQVLLPALLLGALYGLYRLLRKKRPLLEGESGRAPHLPMRPPRWRDKGADRRKAVGGYVIALVLMLMPLAGVLLARGVLGHEAPKLTAILVGLLVLPFAIAVREARAGILRQTKGMRDWKSLNAAAAMALFYTAAAVPAAMVAAVSVPFSEAKVCMAGPHSAKGALVGETSDRIYLGELGDKPLRIVVLPLSRVEEMFVGEDAKESPCQLGAGQ